MDETVAVLLLQEIQRRLTKEFHQLTMVGQAYSVADLLLDLAEVIDAVEANDDDGPQDDR